MKIFKQIFDLFFPPQCIFCDSTLKLAQRPLICESCAVNLLFSETKCPKCGSMVRLNDDLMPVCDICKIAGRYYDGAIFALDYYDSVKNAVHRYKLSRQLYVGDQLSLILSRKLRDAGINRFNTDVILTVPSDKKRNAARHRAAIRQRQHLAYGIC